MTREEILKQGAPIEPNCFETEREEQWYRVGLYEGATANQWHDVSQGDLPLPSHYDKYLIASVGKYWWVDKYNPIRGWASQSEVAYWMEIPKSL